MIRYTCDSCEGTIDGDRFTAKIEVGAVFAEDGNGNSNHDCDHLDMIDIELDALESTGDFEIEETGPKVFSFDLCPRCAHAYVKAPLAAMVRPRLRFSQN